MQPRENSAVGRSLDFSGVKRAIGAVTGVWMMDDLGGARTKKSKLESEVGAANIWLPGALSV